MQKRINYIDAIRGSVMILLVPYHGMRFLQGRGDDILGLDPGIFWLHLWRMGLFFAVSGFLGAMTLSLWGPARQIRQRLIRIGIPLAIAVVTILPLMKIVVLSFVNHRNPDHGRPFYEWTWANVFDPTPYHLWFLSYLLALNLAALLIWAVVKNWPTLRRATESGFRKLISGPLLIPVLAVVSASILWIGGYTEAPGVVAASLIPKAVPLGYYGVFFLVGWMLYRSRDLLPQVEARPWTKMLIGGGFATVCWLILSEKVTPPALFSGWVVAVMVGVAAWCTLFGVWGLFARYLPEARPWVKYLADAAYWVYLIHLPFLLFFEIGLTEIGLTAWLRLVLATAAALAASFGTYALLVRHSPIGRLLHGPRKKRPRGDDSDSLPPVPPASTTQAESAVGPIPPVAPTPEGRPV